MCGIHGYVGGPHSHRIVTAMAEASKHRGPDTLTSFGTESVAIGFNRLRVIGGNAGEQPIYSADGEIVLVGNGEVFNHEQLAEQQGYELRTASDIELILHLYEKSGLQALRMVEGQFSFMLYDRAKNIVCVGRDKWGITPLYYVHGNRGLLVSSSVTSLFASGAVTKPELDGQGLAESWSLYGATPPRTCFKGIEQLPAGHYAVYDLSSGQLRSYKFADPEELIATDMNTDPENLESILARSVAQRLEGEGNVGIYVSGGLDSSIVAALAAKKDPDRIKLFGIQFSDAEYDEGTYQRQLAKALGMDLQPVVVTLDDILGGLQECIRRVEMPLIRSAPVPMMMLSNAVHSQGIKYVLCGEGADELFAGYPVFGKGMSSVADKRVGHGKFTACFAQTACLTAVQEQLDALTKDVSLRGIRSAEIGTKLSRYLLAAQGDRVSMANSVEQRFPFLDNEVSDFAFSCSDDQLIHDTQAKYPLRQVAGRLVPDSLAQRKKQGYLTPDLAVVRTLIQNGSMGDALSRMNCRKAGVFSYNKLQEIYSKQVDDENTARFLLFAYSTHRLLQTMDEVYEKALV